MKRHYCMHCEEDFTCIHVKPCIGRRIPFCHDCDGEKWQALEEMLLHGLWPFPGMMLCGCGTLRSLAMGGSCVICGAGPFTIVGCSTCGLPWPVQHLADPLYCWKHLPKGKKPCPCSICIKDERVMKQFLVPVKEEVVA